MSFAEKPLMLIYNKQYALDEIASALGNTRIVGVDFLKTVVDNVQIHQWEGTNHATVMVMNTKKHVCTVDTWVEPNEQNLYAVLNGALEQALKDAAKRWTNSEVGHLQDNVGIY